MIHLQRFQDQESDDSCGNIQLQIRDVLLQKKLIVCDDSNCRNPISSAQNFHVNTTSLIDNLLIDALSCFRVHSNYVHSIAQNKLK
jgi:hypothetical protein